MVADLWYDGRKEDDMADALPERKLETDEIGYIGDMLRWGASAEKICDTLGVTMEWYSAQLESNEEFRSIVREAKLQRDVDIQRAFFQSAVGGFRTSTSKKYVQKEDGSRQMEVTERTDYVLPDARMMRLMLANTDPWFSDRDSFERKLMLEAQAIRRRLAEGSEWKPVEVKMKGTVKEGEIEYKPKPRRGAKKNAP